MRMLNKNELKTVSGGSGWTKFRDKATGGAKKAYDKVENEVRNGRDTIIDIINPEPKIKVVEVTKVIEVPDAVSQELGKYDWCTCGFKNGTSYNVKLKP